MKNQRVLIIAEAGVNHNGDLNLAKKLIDVAKDSGADIVKFQTCIPENIVTNSAPKANYQKKLTGSKDSQLEMIKKISLSFKEFEILHDYCNQVGITFLSTAFDHDSINFLKNLNSGLFKIPSGEITNLPYIKHVSKVAKQVIISTGMSTIDEISRAIDVLKKKLPDDKISILHCTTEYPAPFDEINLKVIKTLLKKYNLNVGYSDHSMGIEVSIAAVAMGAKIIEKHFTLDSNMDGPDHKASLEPNQLKEMIRSIRNVEKSLGDYEKVVTISEEKNKIVARKSIHIKKEISKNKIIQLDDLIMKRPGDGICPFEIDNIVGKKAKFKLVVNHKLRKKDYY